MRFFVLFFFIAIQICGQNKQKDTISYREYSKLKWQDFKDKAPENTHFSASVSTGMSYKWSYSTAAGVPDFEYQIQANLYRNFSWSIYKTGKEAVLKHEQLHYDITELFVRKFRKALSEYTVTRTIRKDVSIMYDAIEAERNNMQLLYDKETNHSLKKEEQIAWEQKIEKLLFEFEAYK